VFFFLNIRCDRLDLGTENMRNLGAHNDSISTMAYSRDSSAFPHFSRLEIQLTSSPDALITGSWDRTLRFWDSRAPSPQQSSHDTPERVYQLDLVNNTLVVAMASRLFNIYDIRNMNTPAQERESSLKFMTRSLACMPSGQGAHPQTMPYFRSNCLARLRYCFSGRPDSCGILRPVLRCPRQEICIQVPPANHR